MKLSTNRFFLRSLIVASLTLAGTSGIASAAGPDRHHGAHHRHHAGCGCEIARYAGSISIDGRTTSIRADRPMLRQIADAFTCAGYRARIIGGRVQVDYGYHRPLVRWRADGYSARMSWGRGVLRLDLHKQRAHWGRHIRPIRPVRMPQPVFRWDICR
ncbi:MAG: hypothetical protein WD114_01285 [Phycisphaerales bacterium]